MLFVIRHALVLIPVFALLASCSKPPEHPAEVIYYGGPILTMVGDTPHYAEALAVRGGRIQAVGPIPDVEPLRDDSARLH